MPRIDVKSNSGDVTECSLLLVANDTQRLVTSQLAGQCHVRVLL